MPRQVDVSERVDLDEVAVHGNVDRGHDGRKMYVVFTWFAIGLLGKYLHTLIPGIPVCKIVVGNDRV